MLPFLPEYRITHPRFPNHARIAYLMALVAPACGIFLSYTRNLDSPWLWAGCTAGLAMALCLRSAITMHTLPPSLSARGHRLVENSDAWFPYFFVTLQSTIASLIMVVVWFAITRLALPMPAPVHAAMATLAVVLPFRRYAEARIIQGVVSAYDRRFEYLRGLWHLLATFVITHVIMAVTAYDVLDRPHENIHWNTALWVPAVLYMLFTFIMMMARLNKIKMETKMQPHAPATRTEEVDRF